LFSDDSAAIIYYNCSLVDLYGNKETEPEKTKCIQIAKRNLELGQKNYGADSIYLIRPLFDIISNHIA
jgi:hypothetical protein